jgi:hypothetical protein
LWKVTRSITPEISSVAGLCSGIAAFIGDSFSHGRSACVTSQESDSGAIWLPGAVQVGWGGSQVKNSLSDYRSDGTREPLPSASLFG